MNIFNLIATLSAVFFIPLQAHSQTILFEKFGAVQKKAIWNRTNINVCWENPSSADESERRFVRRAAFETWQKHSRLTFTGWERCESTDQGIRILIADTGPHVKELGRLIDGFPTGMVLNFAFENWGTSCRHDRDFCIYALAVHEFGHAIGFAHEQNRADAPEECRGEAQGGDPDLNITEYDLKSVMNYCNPAWNGDGKLSELDIAAVRTIYGSSE